MAVEEMVTVEIELDNDTYEKLKKYAKESQLTISEVVEIALWHYIKKYEKGEIFNEISEPRI